MFKRVLITGGTGLLGKALLETAPRGTQTLATFHHLPPPATWKDRFFHLEFRNETEIVHLLNQIRPDVVIHTAGVGSVDQAERQPEQVRQINVRGTEVAARCCKRLGAFLVSISSNAVFDGEHPPYDEAAPRNPINRYGTLKVEAEDVVRASAIPHLIVRPILMYGWPWPGSRGNVITRWLEALEANEAIRVAEEITSMPLRAQDSAQAIWTALDRGMTGTLHVAGPERLTLVELARITARIFDYPRARIEPVPSDTLPNLAPRPRDTSFLTRRLSHELGIRPIGVEEGLTRMREERSWLVPTLGGLEADEGTG